jgi:hypothetical protein
VEPWVRDEVVVLLATFGAGVLLILGVLELLWPSRPRAARWIARGSLPPLTESGRLLREPSRGRLSALDVADQPDVAAEPTNRPAPVTDLRY